MESSNKFFGMIKARQKNEIIQFLETRGSMTEVDENKENAVHKAVRSNNMDILVAVLAYADDKDINAQSKDGKSSLSLAVHQKNKEMTKLLCDIGAVVDVKEWGLAMMNIKMMSGKDRELLEMIQLQYFMSIARVNGKLVHKLLHIKNDETNLPLTDFDINLQFKKGSKNFFFYLSKVAPEYNFLSNHINQYQRFLGELLHLKCWNESQISTTMVINIPGKLKCNEQVLLIVVEGKGNVTLLETRNTGPEDVHGIELIVDVSLRQSEDLKFVPIAEQFPEIFKISKSASTIKPKMEPGSCIDIAEGTFDSDKKLCLDILETEDWKAGVLHTNVMKIVVQGGLQPKKPITITLPMHTKLSSTDEVQILTSTKNLPSPDDWQETDSSQIRVEGSNVIFQADHLSWFVSGIRNKKTRVQASKCIVGQRRIEIFAMMKDKDKNTGEYTLVLEWADKYKAKKRKKKWKQREYEEQSSVECDLLENRTYKISFSSSLNVDEWQNDKWQFIPLPNESNSYRFIRLFDNNSTPRGTVFIEEPLVKLERDDFNTCVDNSVKTWAKIIKDKKKANPNVRYGKILKLPIGQPIEEMEELLGIGDRPGLVLEDFDSALDIKEKSASDVQKKVQGKGNPKDNESKHRRKIEYKNVPVQVDPTDPRCTIPVLRRRSLMRIGKMLTTEEGEVVGKRLRLAQHTINMLREKANLNEGIFEEWRNAHELPNPALVDTLVDVLKEINRYDEAEIVRQAFKNKTEFNFLKA